jgi:putative NIF3 family GTP cyclohydrolase 1 type 2
MDYSLPFASLLTYIEHLSLSKWLYRFWKEEIKSAAISSGSWWWVLQEAIDGGIDLLITWELVHHEIVRAKEAWLNLILWGHYETEKIGVKLLCYHLKKKFEWLEVIFLDEKR